MYTRVTARVRYRSRGSGVRNGRISNGTLFFPNRLREPSDLVAALWTAKTTRRKADACAARAPLLAARWDERAATA
jgi:hypothetical protein